MLPMLLLTDIIIRKNKEILMETKKEGNDYGYSHDKSV